MRFGRVPFHSVNLLFSIRAAMKPDCVPVNWMTSVAYRRGSH